MKKIKQLFNGIHNITAIGIADIGGNAIAIVFWFIIASTLGAEGYGEISYFIAIASIASTISLIGASNTILVYVPKGEKIQSGIFFISIVCSSIAALVLFLIYQKFEISLITFGFVIFNLSITELLGLKLYKTYFRYVVTQKILMIIFGLGLYYVLGLSGVILGIGISYLLYLERIIRGFQKMKIDFSLIRMRFGFIVNSYILDLSNAFISSVDKIIVGPMFGFLILGNYQLGVQFLTILYLIPHIFYKFLLTQESSGNFNSRVLKIMILISLVLSVIGILISPIILPVLFPKFNQVLQTLQIVSLAVIPYTINLIFVSRSLSTGKSRVVLVGSLIYLSMNISGILVLGKYYGITGIAWSLVLSEIVQVAYYMIIRKRIFSMTVK